MKQSLLASIAVAAAFIAGCEKAKNTTADSVPPPEAPSLPAPEPKTAKPADGDKATTSTDPAKTGPTSQETVPAVPEPPAKPTVGSTVWAAARISVTSDDGVFGVPPGTKLRVVKVTDTGFVVSDEKREFPVTEGQISTGVAAAANAAQADQAHRAADAAWHRAQLDAVNKQREVAAANAKTAEAEKRIKDLRAKLDALVREQAQLRANIESAKRQDNDATLAKIYGRTYTRTITPQHRATWEGRLAVVDVDIQRVQNELYSR